MVDKLAHKQRLAEIRRIFEEYDIGDLEFLERWQGDDMAELAEVLNEEEFQVVLELLQSRGDVSPQ
ncbi:MAG TPA: hypothetical protein VGC54_08775 [Planctomycetota bacterium]